MLHLILWVCLFKEKIVMVWECDFSRECELSVQVCKSVLEKELKPWWYVVCCALEWSRKRCEGCTYSEICVDSLRIQRMILFRVR